VELDVEPAFEFDALEHGCVVSFGSFGSIDVDGVVCLRRSICLEESRKAKYVITVPVADADMGDFWDADACDLELSLCSFSTIEEDALSFEHEQRCYWVALLGGHHAACS